jgi:tetratricopeptide (TPR) repeat protein
MKHRSLFSGLSAIVSLASVLSVFSQSETLEAQIAGEGSLGNVAFNVACDAPVTDEFDRAVALLHHMTYPAAFAAFQDVVDQDPGCSLGYWGMAMTLFQPLWPTRPGDDDLRQGWELVQEARRRPPASTREQMFLSTAEAFFDPAGDPDYWARIERWAKATTELYEAFPDDREAKAFFALAHLATASRSRSAADHHATAAGVLGEILDEEPTHPGAVHYTIHANDFAGRQNESLGVVRRYGEIAPRNPHALHMPTHIFVRLGEWDEVISWNQRAAEAALAQRVGPTGEYVWDEFAHAVEYLIYAHLQRADDGGAERLIRRLNDTEDLQPSFKTAFHLASTASRFALERREWQLAADLPVRDPDWIDWDRFHWPEAVVWFARGLGAAHLGASGPVRESVDRLEVLSSQAAEAGEQLFADQIRILGLEVAAWRAYGNGDAAEAVNLMIEAVELEERTPKHPVTPAPTLPARELLADLYAAIGDSRRAHEAYRASEEKEPGRFNTLLGIARTAAALGDADTARVFYERLLEQAPDDSPRSGVSEARTYLREKG